MKTTQLSNVMTKSFPAILWFAYLVWPMNLLLGKAHTNARSSFARYESEKAEESFLTPRLVN